MDTVKAGNIRNEVEAGLVDAVLTERGIPHIMRSYYDSAYDGMFQTMKGTWGFVLAPQENVDEIRLLLEELRLEAEAELECELE